MTFKVSYTIGSINLPWYRPFIQTDWKWLLRRAWGRRRVSSKAAPGTKAYPDLVGAVIPLWFAWIRQNAFSQRMHIVVTHDGTDHGGNYVAEILAKEAATEQQAKRDDVTARLDDLQKRRAIARSAKDWALADSIRDEIVAVGLIVADERVGNE